MQLRVVTDQPWDVPADVLAIPIVGEPAFDGPLGEVDRREDLCRTAKPWASFMTEPLLFA